MEFFICWAWLDGHGESTLVGRRSRSLGGEFIGSGPWEGAQGFRERTCRPLQACCSVQVFGTKMERSDSSARSAAPCVWFRPSSVSCPFALRRGHGVQVNGFESALQFPPSLLASRLEAVIRSVRRHPLLCQSVDRSCLAPCVQITMRATGFGIGP